MNTFLALRPIPNLPVSSSMRLRNRVVISRLPMGSRPDFQQLETYLSGNQIRVLRRYDEYWLSYEFKDDPVWPSKRKTRAAHKLSDTTLATNILVHTGAAFPVLVFERRHGQFQDGVVYRTKDLHSTLWARLGGWEEIRKDELDLVIQGVTSAIDNEIVRLQHPVELLEYALSTDSTYLRLLLAVAGLDALLLARKVVPFSLHLKNLLGASSYVFPSNNKLGQPKYRVSDVADDLYKLRGSIAHGEDVRQRFYRRERFETVEGHLIKQYDSPRFRYCDLLEECSVFLLGAALKKVFVSGLAGTVANRRQWKLRLRTRIP